MPGNGKLKAWAMPLARRRVGGPTLMLITVILLVMVEAAGLMRRAHAQEPTLTHGPLVGGVTDTSAVVWMRPSGTAQVQVRYSTDLDLATYAESSAVIAQQSRDFTTKIEMAGLSSETVYYLDILVNGVPQLTMPYPHFKTFPPKGEETPFKFVILTDFRSVTDTVQDLPHAETFASADAEEPAFVIIGGDFDHHIPRTLETRRQMFKRLYSFGNDMDDFINLILRHYPVAHVWDDHDYGMNNGDKLYPDKELSLAVLDEYFPVYPMTQYGNWQRFSYGCADFFLLDSRSQRDPNTDPDGPDKSMLDGDNLGEAGQLHWLLQGLQESTAIWKFVKTPSVFNDTSLKDDHWVSFQYERQFILDFIETNDIQGVVMFSGDMHMGGIDDGTNSGVPEMLVPPANYEWCPDARYPRSVWSEGIYGATDPETTCWGYGLVTVFTDPDCVVMEVKDGQGNSRVNYLHCLQEPYDVYLPLVLR